MSTLAARAHSGPNCGMMVSEHDGRADYALFGGLFKTYVRQGVDEAIRRLDDLLGTANCAPPTRDRLLALRQAWSRANDPQDDLTDLTGRDYREVARWRLKSQIAGKNNQQALATSWGLLTHCLVGTVEFGAALGTMCTAALSVGNHEFAQACAETYLAHRKLLKSAANVVPVGIDELGDIEGPVNPKVLCSVVPSVRNAAVAGMRNAPSHCWAEILHLVLEDTASVHPEALSEIQRIMLDWDASVHGAHRDEKRY